MGRPRKNPIAAEAADMAEPAQVEQVETFVEPAQPAGAYVVQWAIKVNGVRYAPGDTVDLSKELAAPFLASGAIK